MGPWIPVEGGLGEYLKLVWKRAVLKLEQLGQAIGTGESVHLQPLMIVGDVGGGSLSIMARTRGSPRYVICRSVLVSALSHRLLTKTLQKKTPL